jgi:hypothetical protein
MRTLWGRPNLVSLIVGAAFAFAPGTALAGTLDQQQNDAGGAGWGMDSGDSFAETFTAGISGGLDRVELSLSQIGGGVPSDPLNVQIRDASGGVPGGTTLASQSVPGSAVPASFAFVPISFTSPAPVVAGTQYSIVTFTAASIFGPRYAWGNSAATNPYAGGAGFLGASSGTPPWTPTSFNPDSDFAFRTYVVPTPPPSTGQRAAALKKCKKLAKKRGWTKERLKKCKRRARLLPV